MSRTLAEQLLEKGIRLPAWNDGQHRVVCPACSAQRRKSREPCLAVEIHDGGREARFHCHHCGFEGGAGEGRGRRAQVKAYRRPDPPKPVPDARAPMLAWFRTRGIGEETVDAFDINPASFFFPQLGEARPCIAFPYRHAGALVNTKYRAAVASEDGQEGKTFAQEKDAEPTLYNADAIEADVMVVVEGEMDVLACWEAGLRSVVSLPSGAAKTVDANGQRLAALEAHADKLAAVQRIIIATDADEPGGALAEALAQRFGKDRCWRVTWPAACKDANDVLLAHGGVAIGMAVAAAKPWPVDGIHTPADFTDELLDLYHGRIKRPLDTGIAELDPFWRLVPGTFTVVTGIPNHGKSAFLDQIAINAAQRHDWRFACFSPEHSPSRHLARLTEKLIRKPFDDGPTARMSEGEVREAIDWLEDRFTFLQSKEAAPSVDWLLERLRWCCIRRRTNAVILDPYNEIEAARPREQTETEFVATLIGKLKRFATAHDVAVFMVVHPTKLARDKDGNEPVPNLYDLSGSAHWRNKADAGIVVHRDFVNDVTQIWVKKIREQPVNGTLGRAVLRFDYRTRQFEGVPEVMPAVSGGDAA